MQLHMDSIQLNRFHLSEALITWDQEVSLTVAKKGQIVLYL